MYHFSEEELLLNETRKNLRHVYEGFWGARSRLPQEKPMDINKCGEEPMDADFIAAMKEFFETHTYTAFTRNAYYSTYMGYSFCRFGCFQGKPCDEMGKGEYVITHTHSNGETVVWVFPDGYLHYVTEHNWHVSAGFQEMILNFKPDIDEESKKWWESKSSAERLAFMASWNVQHIAETMMGWPCL